MALNEQKEEIHVLMVAFAAQGHINPLLRLGKRLVSKGLHVTLAITEIFQHRMLKSSSSPSTNTTNSISEIQLLFFSDGFSIDHDRKSNMDHYMDTIGKFGPINLSNLIKTHFNSTGHKKLSCIINNPFVPWVADVAAELKIPCAMLWIQPCALYTIYQRFHNNLNPFPTLENPDMNVQLPGLPLLHTHDLPSFVLPSNPFGSVPKLLNELFLNLKKLKWVLGNTFYELEKEVIDSMSELYPIKPVGPLVPPSILGEDPNLDIGVEMWEPQESSMEWLNHQQPSSVIYISFGSIIVLSAKQLVSIATAVKISNRPFLWVMKSSEVSAPDDAEEFPSGFLEETKNRGIIVTWCPQTKVLAHPAIACFLTHCGWSSMLEAIATGVPMIGYPQWTDQPTNAKLIADVLKVGTRLMPESNGVVTTNEVERCIEEIMAGPRSEEFKKNVSEFKRAARLAVADGGSSDRNIQDFVDEIIGNSPTSL